MTTTSPSALVTLSNDLAAAVDRISSAVVGIDAGRRHGASGLAWSEHTIVTAEHAIERDEDIDIILPDKSAASATVVGRDPTTDLVLLETSTTLKPARRASLDELAVGHVVLAVGREDDGAIAAAMGIVGSLDAQWRTWRGGTIERFVRPDVSIYPGSSGGPLVDVRGDVIGINTWGLSRRWPVTIPTVTIERIVAQLQSGGIRRGYLGVALQPIRLPDSIRSAFDLESRAAVIVVGVAAGGPAERGGLLIGDVILELGGAAVEDSDDLQGALGADKVGTAQDVRVLRAGALTELSIVVGERSRDEG